MLSLIVWAATACKPVDDTIHVDIGGDPEFPNTWLDQLLKNAKPCSGDDCTCPSDDPVCGLRCERPDCEFDCPPGKVCGFNCPNGYCGAKCRPDSKCGQLCGEGMCGLSCWRRAMCVQSCPNGECWMGCKDTKSCKMVCPGGGCNMTCEGSAQCEIAQCERDCTMRCRNRENCILSCKPENGCFITDIDGPPGDDANDTVAPE